jgi:hypothetical protein
MNRHQIDMLLNDRIEQARRRYGVLISEYARRKSELAGLRELYAALLNDLKSEPDVSADVSADFLDAIVTMGEKVSRDLDMTKKRMIAELKAYTSQIAELKEQRNNAKQ